MSKDKIYYIVGKLLNDEPPKDAGQTYEAVCLCSPFELKELRAAGDHLIGIADEWCKEVEAKPGMQGEPRGKWHSADDLLKFLKEYIKGK